MPRPTFRRSYYLAAVLLAVGACARPRPAVLAPAPAMLAPERAAALDEAVRSEMARQRLVGVAVGVIREGQIAYLQGYGQADRENQTPMTPATVVNWASNSKPMAAVLAMMLVEEGKLDLDADVRMYVPEFPDKGAMITPRLLLCHQSGIVHYTNGRVVPTERTYAVPEPFLDPICSLDKFNQSPLIFAPGEKVSYSSYAYVLLSAVIQRAGGRPYHQQVMTRIAGPAGLRSLQLDLPARDQPNCSRGYMRIGDRVWRAPEEAHYWKHGAGGYKSDVADFARWACALIDGKLVSPAARDRMWTPQRLADGRATTWGLGFDVRPSAWGPVISHGGKQNEATSKMMIYPRSRSGLVLLCNCGYADINALARAAASALDPDHREESTASTSVRAD